MADVTVTSLPTGLFEIALIKHDEIIKSMRLTRDELAQLKGILKESVV